MGNMDSPIHSNDTRNSMIENRYGNMEYGIDGFFYFSSIV